MAFSTVVVACALFIGLSHAVLDNYPLFNGGDEYWINDLKKLTVPNHLIVKRPYGTAPEHCVRTASDNSFCSVYKIEVFDIYYADCHAPWIVCRCTDTPAAYSIDVIANNIGKIPVRARSWVRHYSFYPSNSNGYAAYSTLNDINVFGEYSDSTILFHETGHNIDLWVAGGGVSSYSGGTAWPALGAQDSCVPTAYSKASWAENFAEMSVQATYEENIGGIPIGTQCMSKCLTQSRSILRSAIKIVSGDLCVDRFTTSTVVCVGPDARAQGLCNDVLDTTSTTAAAAKFDTSANASTAIRLATDQKRFDETLAKRHPEVMEALTGKTFRA